MLLILIKLFVGDVSVSQKLVIVKSVNNTKFDCDDKIMV